MAALSTTPVRVAATASTRRERPRLRAGIRIGAAAAILVATALAVGAGPFLRGLAAVSPSSVLTALVLAAVASAAAAWRWQVVCAGYGLPLSRPAAFAAYYRSQFLNAVLPAGVLGDVHRAWTHGRAQTRAADAVRAVAVERLFGQIVQIVLTLGILLAWGFGSPLVPLAWAAAALAALVALAFAVAVLLPRARPLLRRAHLLLRREAGLLHPVLARPSRLLAMILASVAVVSAHVALFLVASVAVGVPLDGGRLTGVALVVLAASAIPVNLGGWGPREAAAGAAFAISGLGAAAGVAVSTTFGVLALVGVLPGALLLLTARRRRT
ncbi:lysylphosphatidylglycerol synthase transmembrane domain-containing protein [Microbacterium sp. 22242]|uniref:lysylphosphatidylglycerol synthase transmembrane domain-containing protein n=1 Tax=Microbacterium sp. 22242 TaxID=3453896 RepID=UPI003F85704E